MEHELHIQVAKEGDIGSDEGRATESAKICPSLRAKNIHTGTVVRMSGIEAILRHRLSRHRGISA